MLHCCMESVQHMRGGSSTANQAPCALVLLPSLPCRSYRFVWGTSAVRPTNAWNALCKLDTVTGQVKVSMAGREKGG